MTTQRALLVGAGTAARQLLNSIRTTPDIDVEFVGVLDDDPELADTSFEGIPVLGSTAKSSQIIQSTGINLVICAIARAGSPLLSRLTNEAAELGVSLLLLPQPSHLRIPGVANFRDLKQVEMTDLLERSTVALKAGSINSLYAGQRILITGAGGSIGREICNQLSKVEDTDLYLVDRDESLLLETHQHISQQRRRSTENLILCDIQDERSVGQILNSLRPDTVIHAAALKHVSFLERFPKEALKVNVLGTYNLVTAARSSGVETFINISTDKAGLSSNILGMSKKIAEQLVAGQCTSSSRFFSVRFGNVFGSRGSLIPTVEHQIRNGLPVVVRSKVATRYFMTIQEAVYLVLLGRTVAENGDVLILDMGDPINIFELVSNLIRATGSSSEIVLSNLELGENEHEKLFSPSEVVSQTNIPKVTKFQSGVIGDLPKELLMTSDARLTMNSLLGN